MVSLLGVLQTVELGRKWLMWCLVALLVEDAVSLAAAELLLCIVSLAIHVILKVCLQACSHSHTQTYRAHLLTCSLCATLRSTRRTECRC